MSAPAALRPSHAGEIRRHIVRDPHGRVPSILSLVSRLLAVAFLLAATGSLRAADHSAALEVKNPWIRWLPGDLPGAGYLTLVNPSDADAFLTGASSDAYARIELHESYTTPDGSSRMRTVGSLRVPAHGERSLAPGSFHFMLFSPRRAIQPGDTVTLELQFKDGAHLSVRLPVKPAGG
ncbi:MAG TPA: copper chaperone PCu(A)C [Opitutus sp.]|nr:copper chaperone PCu(A)C [Opitutus sp.]